MLDVRVTNFKHLALLNVLLKKKGSFQDFGYGLLTPNLSLTIPESNEASQTYSGCYMRRVFASQILITSHHAKPIRPGPILLRANRFPSGEL